MKKRIAKKVLSNVTRYDRTQITKAAKRMGESVGVLSVDWAANEAKDATVVVTYNLNAVDTGRFSSVTLNESAKPKTAFNHRTGLAPTTPWAIPPTTLQEDLAMMDSILGLDAKSLTELKDAAKTKGLKGYSTMKKAELLALLKGE